MSRPHHNAHLTDEHWEATLSREFAPRPRALAHTKPTELEKDRKPLDPAEAGFDIDAAFAAYHAHRQKVQRRAGFFFSLAVAIGATAFFATHRRGTPEAGPGENSRLESEDPIGYAQSLFNRVYGPPTGESRVLKINDLLKRDEGARAEYLRALTSANSHVRMVARDALAASGVPLELSALIAMLDDPDETLVWPLEVADRSASERYVWEAIEDQRTRTRGSVLDALMEQGYASPPLDVDAAVILPYLRDASRDVRNRALDVLGLLTVYEPGPEVERALFEDEDPDMRTGAAHLLDEKLGEAGRDLIFRQMRLENEPQTQRSLWLFLRDSPRAPAFAREMLAKRASDESTRVMYATFLAQRGEPEHGQYLIPLVLGGTNADAIYRLITYAQVLGRSDLRDPILEASARLSSKRQNTIHKSLVLWDLRSDDPARWRKGLDLARKTTGLAGDSLRAAVEALTAKGDDALKLQAAALLEKWDADK